MNEQGQAKLLKSPYFNGISRIHSVSPSAFVCACECIAYYATK